MGRVAEAARYLVLLDQARTKLEAVSSQLVSETRFELRNGERSPHQHAEPRGRPSECDGPFELGRVVSSSDQSASTQRRSEPDAARAMAPRHRSSRLHRLKRHLQGAQDATQGPTVFGTHGERLAHRSPVTAILSLRAEREPSCRCQWSKRPASHSRPSPTDESNPPHR